MNTRFEIEVEQLIVSLLQAADHITGVNYEWDESVEGWSLELLLRATSISDSNLMIGYGMKEEDVVNRLKEEIEYWQTIR